MTFRCIKVCKMFLFTSTEADGTLNSPWSCVFSLLFHKESKQKAS